MNYFLLNTRQTLSLPLSFQKIVLLGKIYSLIEKFKGAKSLKKRSFLFKTKKVS